MQQQFRTTFDSLEKSSPLQQKLIDSPLVVSDKYYNSNRSGIDSYDSQLTFKAQVADKLLRRPADSTSSRFNISDLPRSRKLSMEKESDSNTRRAFHAYSNRSNQNISQQDIQDLNNPFENSMIRNQVVRDEPYQEDQSTLRPTSPDIRPPSQSFYKAKIHDLSLDNHPHRAKYDHNNHQSNIKFKIMNDSQKIVRKAALKYFNNFESLRMRNQTRAESFEVNPILNTHSGHIAIPKQPKNRRPNSSIETGKKTSGNAGGRSPAYYMMNPKQQELISHLWTNVMPSIKKQMVTPIDPRPRSQQNKVVRAVKPTRITYVDQLEKKYQHLLSENSQVQENNRYSEQYTEHY